MVDSLQGHGNWPDGLVPEPEQSEAPPGILYERRDGKLSLSLGVAELGLCKTGTIYDPVLPFSLCLGKCLDSRDNKVVIRREAELRLVGVGTESEWSDYTSGLPGVFKATLVPEMTREKDHKKLGS